MTNEVAAVFIGGAFTLIGTIISTVGIVMIKKAKSGNVHSGPLDVCKNIHKNADARADRIERNQEKINETVSRIDKDLTRVLTKFSSDAGSSLSALATAALLIQQDYEAIRKRVTGEKIILDDDVRE